MSDYNQTQNYIENPEVLFVLVCMSDWVWPIYIAKCLCVWRFGWAHAHDVIPALNIMSYSYHIVASNVWYGETIV